MPKTWVLVADKSRARLFACQSIGRPLEEFEDDVYPLSRLHGNQRFTDGRSRTHTKDHERHTFPPAEPDRDPEAVEFARDLAHRIEIGREQGKFEELIVVAPPEFLGDVRKALSASTLKLVKRTIAANLAHESASEIQRHLIEGI